MSNIEIFRPKSSLFLACVGYLLLFGSTLQSFITDDLRGFTTNLLISALIASVLYSVIQRPRLEIGDEGIKIVNPLTTTYLKWSEIVEIETRYALTFFTSTASFKSWAAVAPGRRRHRAVHPSEVIGVVDSGSAAMRASDSPRTDSGAAAYLARKRWQANSK